MLHIDPSAGRALLAFSDAVHANFGFLCALGFRPVKDDVTCVRYESPEVFVNVYHGRASFELGVEIGRLSDAEKKVNLYEIINWAGAGDAEGFGKHVMFQVSTREGVQEFVPKLARLTQKYGIRLLKGDAAAYREVYATSARSAAEYEKEVALKNVRQKAEAAWHSKDYIRTVELYSAVRNDLTEVEARRLAYAEQQVMSTRDGRSSLSPPK